MELDILGKIIGVSLLVAIMFYLLGFVVIPAFGGLYEYGTVTPCSKSGCTASSATTSFENNYCSQPSNTIVACANCNVSTGYATFLNTCGKLIAYDNDTHCYQCNSFGNKGMYQGLWFIIFLIVLFGLAIMIYKHVY